MAKLKKGGLGKGLDALFVENDTGDTSSVTLRISEIEPNREQPRKYFDEEALTELADSIRQHGVIQPLLVRPMENGTYQLVAGERRWRASRMAGLTEVPVVIKDLSEIEAMELALIENLQRQDVNPIEEAVGFQQLMERYSMTQEQVASRVGKSRPAVANALRLLNLPEQVVAMVQSGEVSPGHARALLKLEDEEQILDIAKKIQKGRYSVRDVEKLTKKKLEEPKDIPAQAPERIPTEADWLDNFFREMELALEAELGRKVSVTVKGKDKGTFSIDFFSKEDLADIAARLTKRSY